MTPEQVICLPLLFPHVAPWLSQTDVGIDLRDHSLFVWTGHLLTWRTVCVDGLRCTVVDVLYIDLLISLGLLEMVIFTLCSTELCFFTCTLCSFASFSFSYWSVYQIDTWSGQRRWFREAAVQRSRCATILGLFEVCIQGAWGWEMHAGKWPGE